jgi:hypothetical protein
MEIKAGDVIYYAVEEASDYQSTEDWAKLNTACAVIQSGEHGFLAVPIDGSTVEKRNEHGSLICAVWKLNDLDGWFRSQAEANKAAVENDIAQCRKWLEKAERCRAFLSS